MFYSFRMSGIGRIDCLSDRSEVAVQYYRHAAVDSFPQTGLGKAALGAGIV